jgi:type VI secretion system secreted protein VgrG
VERVELREAIGELFEMTVELLSPDPTADMHTLVGEVVVVALNDEPFLPQVTGILRRVEQLSSVPGGASAYRWTLVPPLWLATRRKDNRIFQNLDVPSIVALVLADGRYAGRIPPPKNMILPGTFQPREYVVQYEESDYDFVLRLLADEGIASFFDHASASAWTLVDNTNAVSLDMTQGATIPFVPPSGVLGVLGGAPSASSLAPHVQSAMLTSDIATSTVTLRDYNYENPVFVLEATAPKSAQDLFPSEADLDSYSFEVGAFKAQGAGDSRAQRVLDAERARRLRVDATANFALSPGNLLRMGGHPRSDLDTTFLVTRASLIRDVNRQAAVRRLELVDAALPFRPARRPKPRIPGTQTAFVVCPPGQEIDVDPLGRVEVEFRWDRRDIHSAGTSRRVRVAQGWAGAGYGFAMFPRSGHEVVIAYLDGDPDQPLIVGRVHNGFSTSPVATPQNQTQSEWRSQTSPGGNGFNSILMEDQAGAELLALRAQRDLQLTVLHNSNMKVAGAETSHVEKDSDRQVGGDQSLKVKGNYQVEAGGILSLTAVSIEMTGHSVIAMTTALRLDETSGDHSIVAGNLNIVAPTIAISTGKGASITMSGGNIRLDAETIDIVASGNTDIKGALIKLNS